MKDIMIELEAFRDQRNWNKFHTPRNLILALMGEVAELASTVQWNEEVQCTVHIEHEISDCFIYLFNLCNAFDIDPEIIIKEKIRINGIKYPIETSY